VDKCNRGGAEPRGDGRGEQHFEFAIFRRAFAAISAAPRSYLRSEPGIEIDSVGVAYLG
jgi:hypothetical protein